MSFGYGVGDIIVVTQLAWKCVRNAREACGEHDALTREVSSLHSLLSQLQLEKASPESLLNQPDDDRNEELNRLVANCEEVLNEIDAILNKYSALYGVKHGKGKRIWQKVKFGNDEMQDLIKLRQKMGHHTQAIVLFCNLLSMGSQGRVEKYMRSNGVEVRELCLAINSTLAQLIDNGKPEGTVLTMYSEDDPAIWKELRRQLVHGGHNSNTIQENFESIKAYVRELGDRGVLDDNRNIGFVSPRAIEGPVKWQLDQTAWQDISSQPLAQITQGGPQPSSRFIEELQRVSRMHGVHFKGQSTESLVIEQEGALLVQDVSATQDSVATAEEGGEDDPEPRNQVAGTYPPEMQESPFMEQNLPAIAEIRKQKVVPRETPQSVPAGTTKLDRIPEEETRQDGALAFLPSSNHASLDIRPPLRLLPSYQLKTSQEYSVNIIVLPEIQFLGSARPTPTHWKWLNESLATDIPGCRILDFEYSLKESTFSCFDLLDQGALLLQCILCQHTSFLELPLIFICHGLSGFILKGALVTASKQLLTPNVMRLLETLSGFIFLGCPHPKREQSWPSLSRLLKTVSRLPKLALAKAELESKALVNTCRKFEELKFRVEVISAYETIETRIQTSLWRSQKSVLVDSELAMTSLRQETLIPVASDHYNICHFPADGTIFLGIKNFVKAAISSHAERLQFEIASSLSVIDRGATNSDSEHSSMDPGPSPEISGIVAKQPASTMWSNTATFDTAETIPMLSEFTITPREPKLPVFMIPHKQNPQFWGRNDVLEKLDSILLRNSEARDYRFPEGTSCAVMTGLGGVGKTELALHYTHTRKKNFDAVFWVRADESLRLAQEFAHLSVTLGLESREDCNWAVSRNLVLGWLASTERTWLLVFDNANMEILNDYWPISNNGAIIVTSRDALASTQLYQASGIVVGPFSTEDASSFLRYLTNEGANSNLEDLEATHTIATSLGGLPLAITQMASFIRHLKLSYNEFIQLYNAEFSAIVNLNLQGVQTLSTVWAFERLQMNSKALLDVLSFFEPDHISESLLRPNLWTNPDAAFLTKSIVYLEARTELTKSSLITRNRKTSELSIHRVVQDIVRSKMSITEVSEMFGISVSLLRASWPHLVDPFVSFPAPNPTAEEIVSHLLKMKAIYEQHGGLVIRLDLGTFRNFAEVLKLGGWYLLKCGSFKIAHSLLSLALRTYKESKITEAGILADTLFSLATLGVETNQDSATILSYSLEHLKVRIDLNRGEWKDQELLSMAHCRLAQAYMFGGEYEKAISHCKHSKSVLSIDPESCAWYQWSQIFQAWCLIATSDLEEAESVILAQLQYQTEHVPSKESGSLMLAHTLKCMGTLRLRQELLEESFNLHGGALSNFVATTGYNTYDSSLMCVKLGVHHTRLDQFETASIYLDQALKWFSMYEFYAGEITYVNYKMALLRKAQGDEIGASELLAKTEKLYTKLVPTYDKKRCLSDADIDGLVVLTSR